MPHKMITKDHKEGRCMIAPVNGKPMKSGFPHLIDSSLSSADGFRRSLLSHALLALVFILFSAPGLNGQTQPSSQQAIPLELNWNLISIQVGGPITPAAFQASLQHPDRLIEIWGYDSNGNPAVPGSWKVFRFGTNPAGFPNDLTTLQPGRAYWLKIGIGRTTVTLNGIPWDGSVSVRRGWNLVGFPGLATKADEIQELSAVFGSSFNRIQQVWGHDAASNRFLGYDTTAIPQLKELASVSPGRGYWVYSIADTDLTLSPSPFIAPPSDSDASPPQAATLYAGVDPKYVGKQVRLRATDGSDTPYDLNANGILDDASTQDTILFEKTADTVSITIGNLGSGICTWSLENSVPWLFTAPSDARTWPTGVTSRPATASGTVSTENDTLMLYADRSGMTPGRKTAEITLWVGGQAFPIHLLLDVATVDGDWRGVATTTRCGGRNIALGEVRLGLSTFSIGGNEASGFRTVLNREQSILFPRDVYMDGVFYAANQFKLTTNFEMKAGDRNAPPYDTFPGDAKDRDTNGDGKVDVMNPFPFGLRREVTLLGSRVTPNRLEGTYIESIRGMLPPLSGNNLVTDTNQFLNEAFLTQSQPVFIEGTFVLERQTFTPTQRSVFNQSADLQLNIGGSDTTGRTVTFDVTTPVTVQGVTLTLDLTFPDPALLQIRLISPTGTSYLIHDFGDNSQPPSSLTIPGNIFAGENGAGEWILQIDWDGSTGERGTLGSWGLNIEGASTHSATGRIMAAGNPVTGATIRLEGGVTTQTFTTDATGTFTIPDLTENDYTLYITKPGYQTTTYTFFVSENDLAIGDIVISPLGIAQPQLTAAPPIGYAGSQPLHVEFIVDLPLGFAGTDIAWDFEGDGSTDQSGPLASLTGISHDYPTPGIYTAKATLSGGSLGAPIEKTQIIHVHRGIADPAGGSTQIMLTGFVGAMGARTDLDAGFPHSDPVSVEEPDLILVTWLGTPPAPRNLVTGFTYQESIWDVSAFDLDRIPLAPNATFPGPEDIDLVGPNHPSLRYIRFNANSANPTKYEALTYSTTPTGSRSVEANNPAGFTHYIFPAGTTKPNRFRFATAFGGAVFNTTASAVGDIKILPGRTLPQ